MAQAATTRAGAERAVRALAIAALMASSVGFAPDAGPGASSGSAGADAAAPETESAEARVEARVAAVTAAEPGGRARALKACEDLDADATDAIIKKLDALPAPDPHDITAWATRARAAFADRQGKRRVEPSLTNLLDLPSTAPDIEKTLVSAVCLVRALGKIGTTNALKRAIHTTGEHGGLLRPEVLAILRPLGERAVAPLIVARRDRLPAVRGWAFTQLEAMNKRLPGEAIQTESDAALSDVLLAFGTIRDMDAVGIVLGFANSSRAPVRAAARESLVRYGDSAIAKLRESYTNLAGTAPPASDDARQLAERLFALLDRHRLEDVFALFEEGEAQARDGHVDAAAAAFDQVLAREPMFPPRQKMASVYAALGRAQLASDAGAAEASFRKATRLDPDGPHSGELAAELAFLEGKDAMARGLVDRSAFERALAANPNHEGARAMLAQIDAQAAATQKRQRIWNTVAIFSAILGTAAAAILLWLRRRGQLR
jgi:hypothetical protein